MIDWLNFWIGIVFAFAGISILISALRYYLQISFSKYILVASAGLAFFLIGGNLILNSPIEFNPALHECTAMGWKSNEYKNLYSECYGTCNFLRYEFEINTTKEECNKFCVFGKQKCVSFRAKTECELGNISYVEIKSIQDGYIECVMKSVEELEVDYCRENPSSAYLESNEASGFKKRCHCVEEEVVGIVKKCVSAVPMSKKLYCEENPTDTIKCSCLNYEVLAKDVCQESENYKEDVDCRLNFGYVFTYGNTHFAGKVINASEATWYDEIPYYSWDVSNSDGSGFGAKQPLECIRAVPKVGE